MPVELGTKAETLERLNGSLKGARILPLVRFSTSEWSRDPAEVLERLRATPWGEHAVVVRSSARQEDRSDGSLAGRFVSVLGVRGAAALREAVERVIASYDEGCSAGSQVFVQPMLEGVTMSGVVFGADPSTGSPYVVINYDDASSDTTGVTGGRCSAAKTFYMFRGGPGVPPPHLAPVVALLEELEEVTGAAPLDVEFAVAGGVLHLLQVRPLTGVRSGEVPPADLRRALEEVAQKVTSLQRPHPYLHGARTVLGVMPDWNPGEIVGVRPRPLALTLYRELVTDSIWAYQRDNYGYRNLRSFPLLVSLHGAPYIDVRVSFNSFIPKDIADDLASRLADYYIDCLVENPSHHDKVEFEIIYTCYTLDLPQRLGRLRDAGATPRDCETLAESLRRLTNEIVHVERGLWRKDVERIHELERRFEVVTSCDLDPLSKIYWLLEDCKRYGTLPFAGLARAAFIAVQLLRSLVANGILSSADYHAFIGSLETVSTQMTCDLARLPRSAFLERYGHLRPGTYDILSPRYDEDPDRYFDWSRRASAPPARERFMLSLEQMRALERQLKEHRLDHDVLGLFDFIKGAIEGRERAKFVFTRSLSQALAAIGQLGREHGLDLDDCSYLDIGVVSELHGAAAATGPLLRASVREGRARHAITRGLVLSPLITRPEEVWAFHVPPTEPNYITQRAASGPVGTPDMADLVGRIVVIPSADPGFDWIFSRGIAGFITMFGGCNSHMAIRAGELGIPAVIGAGETLFRICANARVLHVDCANRLVRVIQ